MTRICKKCREEKSIYDFWKIGASEARQYQCIDCMKKRQVEQQLKRDKANAEGSETYKLSILRYLLRMCRRRAKDSGLECSITHRDIVYTNVCPVLGTKLKRNTGSLDRNSFSLDRLDSTKGYIAGNVRIVSWQFNNLKSNMTLEQAERFYLYMKGVL